MALALGACSENQADNAADQAKDAASQAQDAAEKARDKVNEGVDSLPKVDWKKHGRDLKRRLDQLADKADCQGLENELAKAEKNDTDLTRYIKRQVRKAC